MENEAVVILFQYNLMIYGADQIVGLNPVDGFKTTCLRHTSIVEHVLSSLCCGLVLSHGLVLQIGITSVDRIVQEKLL